MTIKIATAKTDLVLNEPRLQAEHVFDLLDVSDTTRKDYKYRIGLFLNFIKEQGFNLNSFLEYKRYLKDRADFSISTKSKYLVAAKRFLNEISRRKGWPDITLGIKCFKKSNKHKREGLKQNEIESIIVYLQRLEPNPKNCRLKALFCFLAFQGLRQIEIRRLLVDDINFAEKQASIQGKGQEDKESIHLHPQTIKVLKEYLKISKIASGAVFRSFSNRKSPQLSMMSIFRELQTVFNELGIKKTIHGFRHYYITTLLAKLKDINTVRKFTRHNSLNTLIVYDDALDIRHKTKDVFKCFSGLKVSS